MGASDLVYSNTQYYIYNLTLIIGWIILVVKNFKGVSNINLLVITLFFGGVFTDLWGANGRNTFQIITLLWAASYIRSASVNFFYNKHPLFFWAFIFYCGYFLILSIIIHRDDALMVFSQLSKIVTPFLIFITITYDSCNEEDKINYYHDLFGEILLIIIISSIAKLIIMGEPVEGWIGGVTGRGGGGAGTSLPLLGLIWLALQTGMKNLSLKSILFIIGLLTIGFAAGKRAIWLEFPILYFALSGFVYGRNYLNAIVSILVLVPIIFYFGLRLSPTLNPENKIWGSFDPEYAFNYSLKYSSGIDRTSKTLDDEDFESGEGRLGSLIWLKEHIAKNDEMTWLGLGNEYFVYADIKDYSNKNYYMGITYRGGITGVVRWFMITGLVGMVLYLILIFHACYRKGSRLSVILLSTVFFDFIFYNGQSVNNTCLFLLVLFMAFCCEWQIVIEKKGNEIDAENF